MARKHCFEDTAVFKILWPWFDHSKSFMVKGHNGNWKFSFNFLSAVNSNYKARKHRLEDTAVWKYCDLDLTFWGHPRSKVMKGKASSHITSYLLLIVTIRLGSMCWRYSYLKILWPWYDLSRSKVIRGIESSHRTSHLLIIVTIWLGSTA